MVVGVTASIRTRARIAGTRSRWITGIATLGHASLIDRVGKRLGDRIEKRVGARVDSVDSLFGARVGDFAVAVVGIERIGVRR
jgi:hypothetical protein